jgi:hypothetical protein
LVSLILIPHLHYEGEHSGRFLLFPNFQLDAASRVKRTEVSILKHHLYSEEQGSILDIVIKAMH